MQKDEGFSCGRRCGNYGGRLQWVGLKEFGADGLWMFRPSESDFGQESEQHCRRWSDCRGDDVNFSLLAMDQLSLCGDTFSTCLAAVMCGVIEWGCGIGRNWASDSIVGSLSLQCTWSWLFFSRYAFKMREGCWFREEEVWSGDHFRIYLC